MSYDICAVIEADVNRYRRRSADRPDEIRLHPATWAEITADARAGRYTFQAYVVPGEPPPPRLFGVRVIEDPTLDPGTWRLVPPPV